MNQRKTEGIFVEIDPRRYAYQLNTNMLLNLKIVYLEIANLVISCDIIPCV